MAEIPFKSRVTQSKKTANMTRQHKRRQRREQGVKQGEKGDQIQKIMTTIAAITGKKLSLWSPTGVVQNLVL